MPDTVTVLTADTVRLVQRAYAFATQDGNMHITETCRSLESVLVSRDLKKGRVSIPRDPHEKQINEIVSYINHKEQS